MQGVCTSTSTPASKCRVSFRALPYKATVVLVFECRKELELLPRRRASTSTVRITTLSRTEMREFSASRGCVNWLLQRHAHGLRLALDETQQLSEKKNAARKGHVEHAVQDRRRQMHLWWLGYKCTESDKTVVSTCLDLNQFRCLQTTHLTRLAVEL